MNLFNPQVLADLIYTAPERCGTTVRRAAERMGGIDEKYLARQINPNDAGAKMGVEDFVYFSAVTDLKTLDYMEQVFGRVGVPLPVAGDPTKREWLEHVATISKEAGDAVSCMAASLAAESDGGGAMTAGERDRCRTEVFEAIQALAALWQALTSREDG